MELLIKPRKVAIYRSCSRGVMITSNSLRRSGVVISNARQQLIPSHHGARFVGLSMLFFWHLTDHQQYSITSSRTPILKGRTTRSQQQSIYQTSTSQTRSISLWGLGSSTPKDADFAKAHSPGSSAILGHDGQILAGQPTPSSQSTPAVHQTSDSPSAIPSGPNSIPAQDVFTQAEEPSLADSSLDPAEAFSSIPERIGYLKDVCGLDFGWGPASLMEWVLEHIHISGGFTWAASIALLALMTRTLLFWPMLKSSDMGARWKIVQPIVKPLQDKMQAAVRAKDQRAMLEAKAELSTLRKELNVSPMKMILPILIQIPLQYGGFRVLRNMAGLPVPALETENWLWAQDLTLGDPFFILPIANAVILYMTIKVRNQFLALH
jgi:YidC/Oxa1 family membrane protein insertase